MKLLHELTATYQTQSMPKKSPLFKLNQFSLRKHNFTRFEWTSLNVADLEFHMPKIYTIVTVYDANNVHKHHYGYFHFQIRIRWE